MLHLLLHSSPPVLPGEPLSSENKGLYLPFPISRHLIYTFRNRFTKVEVTCNMA